MSISDDIINAANKARSYYMENFCKRVCSLQIVNENASPQFSSLVCSNCKAITQYVADEVVAWAMDTDWDSLYGTKNMSMENAIRYINNERTQIMRQLNAIPEYANRECERLWNIRTFETGMSREAAANPLISGMNEFFEQENYERLKRMSMMAGSPETVGHEFSRCKKAAMSVLKGMIRMMKHDVPALAEIV